jgi:hypothetical protein
VPIPVFGRLIRQKEAQLSQTALDTRDRPAHIVRPEICRRLPDFGCKAMLGAQLLHFIVKIAEGKDNSPRFATAQSSRKSTFSLK